MNRPISKRAVNWGNLGQKALQKLPGLRGLPGKIKNMLGNKAIQQGTGVVPDILPEGKKILDSQLNPILKQLKILHDRYTSITSKFGKIQGGTLVGGEFERLNHTVISAFQNVVKPSAISKKTIEAVLKEISDCEGIARMEGLHTLMPVQKYFKAIRDSVVKKPIDLQAIQANFDLLKKSYVDDVLVKEWSAKLTQKLQAADNTVKSLYGKADSSHIREFFDRHGVDLDDMKALSPEFAKSVDDLAIIPIAGVRKGLTKQIIDSNVGKYMLKNPLITGFGLLTGASVLLGARHSGYRKARNNANSIVNKLSMLNGTDPKSEQIINGTMDALITLGEQFDEIQNKRSDVANVADGDAIINAYKTKLNGSFNMLNGYLNQWGYVLPRCDSKELAQEILKDIGNFAKSINEMFSGGEQSVAGQATRPTKPRQPVSSPGNIQIPMTSDANDIMELQRYLGMNEGQITGVLDRATSIALMKKESELTRKLKSKSNDYNNQFNFIGRLYNIKQEPFTVITPDGLARLDQYFSN